MKSGTTLSLYFKCDDELTFECEGMTVETSGSTSSYQIARIRNIKAANIGDDITLKVIKGGVEYSVTYNPLTYCYNVVKGTGYEESLVNVCKALYNYWEEAVIYFQQ
ncbi:hypothetical protein SAMN02910456_02400 [Ruminococcaceae bacterium YRB3002]|nr:hypothetical protein SAMN02910456_02400 [Ruminococcaceae bacterium YRB3002]